MFARAQKPAQPVGQASLPAKWEQRLLTPCQANRAAYACAAIGCLLGLVTGLLCFFGLRRGEWPANRGAASASDGAHAPSTILFPPTVLALTFDDGPDPRYTPRILAILRRYHAKATFFQVGKSVQAYPQLAQAVVAEGHVIGNHTYSHPYLNRLSARAVRREIAGGEACLERYLHLRSHLFRSPRGENNLTIIHEALTAHCLVVNWTVALEHHDAPTPQAMVDRALRLIRPGGILLMHDGGLSGVKREKTVEALPLLLARLKARGYRFVTIPQLLHIPGDERLPVINLLTMPDRDAGGRGPVSRSGDCWLRLHLPCRRLPLRLLFYGANASLVSSIACFSLAERRS